MNTWPANIGKMEGMQITLRDSYAWPGGYPIYYLVKDGGILCPDCANGENGSRANPVNMGLDSNCPDDDQWYVIGRDINWEDTELFCDHCNGKIDPAYD